EGRRAGLAQPEHLARPADLEVALGELEAVGDGRHGFEPELGVGGGGVADEDADALALAAPDAPAQLVELSEPETLRLLDDHDVRVGHVDADLDDGRRDDGVDEPGAEALHDVLARLTLQLAVE